MQPKRKFVYIALGSVLLLNGVVLLIPVFAQAPQQAQIAFTSNRDGNWNIYVMDADGNNPIRVTDLPGDTLQRTPSWSPDGRRIAFSSHWHQDGRGLTDIYVVDADGKNLRKLVTTDWAVWTLYPSWSPDSKRIVFGSLDVVEVESKNVGKLPGGLANGATPAWSPDGRKIAYYSARRKAHEDAEIYVMDASGANRRRLTNRPMSNEWCPAWSPDGQQIAFVSGVAGKGFGISVMGANGGNIRKLASFAWWDSRPTWSPDSQRIAFASEDEEIYVIDVDGKNRRNLTNHPARDLDPDWFDPAFARPVSPAGKQPLMWGWLKRLGLRLR